MSLMMTCAPGGSELKLTACDAPSMILAQPHAITRANSAIQYKKDVCTFIMVTFFPLGTRAQPDAGGQDHNIGGASDTPTGKYRKTKELAVGVKID